VREGFRSRSTSSKCGVFEVPLNLAEPRITCSATGSAGRERRLHEIPYKGRHLGATAGMLVGLYQRLGNPE
jgi:hypothetical protein